MTLDIRRPSPSELERLARTFDPSRLTVEERKQLADHIRYFKGNYRLGVVAYFVDKIEEAENARSNKRNKS